MMEKYTYLVTDSTDPSYNLAFEEYILREKTGGSWLMLWSNDRSVILGQNQLAAQEVDLEYARTQDIKVVRRMSGGGAVYHDLGNLNYSFITDVGDVEEISIQRFTEPIVKALIDLGLKAEAVGRNDILVNGRKVSGTADRLMKNRLLHHGTLLFDSDLETAAAVLRPGPGKFHSKASQSVRARICNIRDYLEQDLSISEFQHYLAGRLCSISAPQHLSEDEVETVRKLANQKYRNDEWNFGYEADFDYVNRARFRGGSLEVRLKVQNGVIVDGAFYGDFLSRVSPEQVLTALKGCPYQRDEILYRLDKLPLINCFGLISKEEIVSIMGNPV